jgi:hypothetical protein
MPPVQSEPKLLSISRKSPGSYPDLNDVEGRKIVRPSWLRGSFVLVNFNSSAMAN